MATPKAVTEAARKADEIHKQTYTAPEEPQVEPPAEPEPPKTEPPVELKEPGTEPPKVEEPPKPKPEESPDYWKQRFQTIKGKYDAEVPRLVAQVRTLEHNNTDLTHRITELERQLREVPAKNTPVELDEPLVSEAEKNEYGPEFTAFLERIAKTAAQKVAVKTQTAPAAPKPQEPAQKQAPVTAGPTIYSVLDQRMPRWREINRDPEFVGWLQHPDPFSGSIRHHMLTQAFDSGDAARVLAFFDTYARSHGVTHAAPPKPADPAPQGTPAPGKIPLETLAGPRQNAPQGQPQQPANKRVWSGKEIDAFYRKCVQGFYRGKEAEKAKIEAEIATALAEGRIQPGR